MSGISYLGMVSWVAAQHDPPSLKAVVPWESGNDMYFSLFRPGGLFNANFLAHWWQNCVVPYQHGRSEGVPEVELQSQRVDFLECCKWEFRGNGPFPLLARFRGPDRVKIPFYSSANWMDTEVHSPGNILGYMWGASKVKYLQTHAGDHIHAYYGAEGLARQKQFLDHFLKDDNSSLDSIPKVDLLIRRGSVTYRRAEEDFPPQDTQYREYFLTSGGYLQSEDVEVGGSDVIAEYEGLQGSRLFATTALEEDFELLGFPYLVLNVATDAKDMDIFLSMTNIAPNGKLVEFEGNHGETSFSVTRGYMRLSHRELDLRRSTQRLIILRQQESAPVVSGRRYTIQMPIQPTSMVYEKGHRIQIELGGQDSQTLLGVMRHEGADRTRERFGGKNTFFSGSKIVLPFVRRAHP